MTVPWPSLGALHQNSYHELKNNIKECIQMLVYLLGGFTLLLQLAANKGN